MSLNSALSLVRTWVQHALEQCVQQAKQQPDTDSSTAGELFWNLEHHNEQGNVVAFCFSGELRLHFAVRQVSIARRQDEEADERHRAATRSGTRVSPLCTLVFSVAKDVEDMEFDRPSHFWVLIFFFMIFLWPTRYEGLLNDCQTSYFTQRLVLLQPSVLATLSDLSAAHQRDHCVLTRSACAFLLRVCHDEWQLFHQFFGQSSPLLQCVDPPSGNQFYVTRTGFTGCS